MSTPFFQSLQRNTVAGFAGDVACVPTRPDAHPANSIILPATPCVFRAKSLDSALAPAFPCATPAHSISVKVD